MECVDAVAKDGKGDEESTELHALSDTNEKVGKLQEEVNALSKKMDRVLAALESK